MNLTTMILSLFLLFGTLAVSPSCTEPVATAATANSGIKQASTPLSAKATGDTVSAIDTSIWYVFQDKHNNYWFGSNGQGVYRYDGKNIIQFTHQHGLCSDHVRAIQQDGTGNIYINTVSGVSMFDGHAFTTLPCINGSAPNYGWALQPGDLWFAGAQDSGVVYRYNGTTLYRLKFPKTKAGEDFIAKYPRSQYPQMTFSPYDVYSIFKDSKGALWFGTNIGLCRYDGEHYTWISEKEIGIDAIAIHVRSTVEDKNGHFWFGNIMHRFGIYPKDQSHNTKGPISFEEKAGIVSAKEHDAAYSQSATEDNNGDLWTVTYNKGVWRYDGKDLTQYEIKNGNKVVTLYTIYKDRQGTLWLGTHTAGAYKFNGKAFERFEPKQ